MRFRSVAEHARVRRMLPRLLSVALVLIGGATAAFAQNAENGQRLAERWCTECHAIGPTPAKLNRALPFGAIAAKPDISADMIASFLLLPHATMPNWPWVVGTNQTFKGARFIQMYDLLKNPWRTAFISMPKRKDDTAVRVKYGGFPR